MARAEPLDLPRRPAAAAPLVEIPDPIGQADRAPHRLAARRADHLGPVADAAARQCRDAAPGFEAFGIRPAPLAAVAEGWLTLYRRHGRFARAPAG